MPHPSPILLPALDLYPGFDDEEEGGGGEEGTGHKRHLSPLGIDMRDSLPPVLRDAPDYLAVINALARECERAAGQLEQARAQLNPGTADVLLGVWERITRQTVEPVGLTIAERQAAVLARMRKLLSIGYGSSWEEQVTALIGPGWDYEEHIPGKPLSPPPNTIKLKLPYPPEGSRYLEARDAVREVTPAHLEIETESGEGFILDQSHLDIDTMPV